jgi:hypothetical protein
MGEQRRGRGGRGRSGRGGRIPRRGEQGGAPLLGEDFTPFPYDLPEPIRVELPLSADAVAGALNATLGHETAQLAGLEPLLEAGGPVLARVKLEVERHRDTLEQLARDLGAEVAPAESAAGGVLAAQRLSLVGWQTLQRAAYAFGDRRIDRVVRPVLREKARHAEVIEDAVVAGATRSFFREMD